MDRLEVEAREAVRGLGRRGRTQRVPTAVRERVVAYACAARARGVTWRRIARSVGLSTAGVQRFAKATAAPQRAALVAVALRPPVPEGSARPGLTWLTPGGHRLERLSVEEALVLLRGLG